MKATGATALLGLASGSASAQPDQATEDACDTGRAPTDRHGPMRTGRFVVEFDGEEIPGWKTVTIPSVSIEGGTYREGNEAPQEKKVAGQPTYDDLEMERGVKVGDTTVWDWIDTIRHGKVDGSRREIAVVVMDTEGNAQTRWEFTNAWPTNYDPPDLDASADGDIATESLTVAFDEMIRAE